MATCGIEHPRPKQTHVPTVTAFAFRTIRNENKNRNSPTNRFRNVRKYAVSDATIGGGGGTVSDVWTLPLGSADVN